MAPKKILFLYIHPGTGHEAAARALQEAVRNVNPRVSTEAIDSLRYMYPILSKVVSKTYSGIIKRTPQLWDYLYDNSDILNATATLRNMLGKLKLKKIEKLLAFYDPDAVVCTQAAPCVLLSAYKEQTGWRKPLIGVVTDYRAHAYWYAPYTNLYIVPTGQTKQDLIQLGIPDRKIKALGLPIDPKFAITQDKISAKQRMKLNPWLPTILVMGGSQGLGPLDAVIKQLAEVRMPIQTIVICGTNRKLRRKMKRQAFHFGSSLRIMGYTKNIDKIMAACDLIITKPGGMTSSEALAKNLPLIIISPIPGQEEKNSQFLCKHHVAIRLDDISELQQVIEYLIRHPEKLEAMRENTEKIAKPNASLLAVNSILDLLNI
ncbi:MAG: glycosyltransferase [Elusimicrobia bacterium]|nr:glycosyltransferase [Elusimicrobiota bacterium]